MNRLVDLSNVLIALNNIENKNSIVGLSDTKKIITEQEHKTINENTIKLGFPASELETFATNITKLKDRLIKLDIDIEEKYLTPQNIEKKIKHEIINSYQQNGHSPETIQSTLVGAMEEALQQKISIEAQSESVAMALDGKLKQQHDFKKNKLLSEIHENLTNIKIRLNKYGDFSQAIENEFLNYKTKSIQELKNISSSLQKRMDLLAQEISNLQKTYDYLSGSIKQQISIFKYHKNISDLINSGNSTLNAFNLEINRLKNISDLINLGKSRTDGLNLESDRLNASEYKKATENAFVEDKFPEGYINAKDVQDTYAQAKSHIIATNNRQFLNFDGSLNDDFVRLLQDNMSKVAFMEYIHIKKDIDVSLSELESAGNTCWLNSSLKYIYSYYGKDRIKQAINNLRNNINASYNQEINKELLLLLAEFDTLFDKMAKNEIISTEQLANFLLKIYTFGKVLEKYDINNDEINKISYLIKPAIEEKNGVLHLKLGLIEQELPKEFFLAISVFLGLQDESQQITRRVFNKYTIQKQDLQSIGIDISADFMEIEVKTGVDVVEMSHKIPGTGEPNDQRNIRLRYLTDYLARGVVRSNLSQNDLDRISKQIAKLDSEIKIPCKVVDTEMFYADTKKLRDFSIDFIYAKRLPDGRVIKDINKTKDLFKQVYPKILLDIIDINTGEKHIVEAVPTAMILHMGTQISVGHYIAMSLSNDGEIIIHNDQSILNIDEDYFKREGSKEKLEQFKQLNNLEKLVKIMDLHIEHPTDISFKVTSVTPKR